MEAYWEKRFVSGGRIWGDAPSRTAVRAERIFRDHGIKNLIIPGAGYGRHVDFFAAAGYQVTGIEISAHAIALARTMPGVRYRQGSVLDESLYTESYDAVYGFNILHLFRAAERLRFIELLQRAVRGGGLVFMTGFSEEEPQFGRGKQVEENTYESKPGRSVHFFNEPEMRSAIKGWAVLEAGLIDDPENHGAAGPHTHRIRYVCAQKPDPSA